MPSACPQPVSTITRPATAAAIEESMSKRLCRNAPCTFRLSRLALPIAHAAAPLTAAPSRPGPEDERALDVRRVDDPRDRLDADDAGEDEQQDAVDLRAEDLAALEAERERALRRALGEPERDDRQADRAGVGEHVRGVRDQRQRVRDDADDDLDDHEAEVDHAARRSASACRCRRSRRARDRRSGRRGGGCGCSWADGHSNISMSVRMNACLPIAATCCAWIFPRPSASAGRCPRWTR